MTMLIETPASNDVLCGKDKTFQLHPGNRLYRRLIEEAAVHYSTVATKQDKMGMTQQIVHTMMHEHEARFLRHSSDSDELWEEITHQMARDKTSHALRFCAASLGRKQPSMAMAPASRKRGHRRTVSRDSNASTTVSGNKRRRRADGCVTIVASARSYTDYNCTDLFARQQVILQKSLHAKSRRDLEDDDPIPVVVTSSEDLDLILSEPLNMHDWDGLFQEL